MAWGERSRPTASVCGCRSWPTTARTWYRAHNASIVSAYLDHLDLTDGESGPERFFLNVVLLRVLYAHALVARPRLALGGLAPWGHSSATRVGMTGLFLSLSRVLPDRYPLDDQVTDHVAAEQHIGRMLDYGIIAPRLQPLYEWSAHELDQPALLGCIRQGSPTYAWSFADRQVWHPDDPPAVIRVVGGRCRHRRVGLTTDPPVREAARPPPPAPRRCAARARAPVPGAPGRRRRS